MSDASKATAPQPSIHGRAATRRPALDAGAVWGDDARVFDVSADAYDRFMGRFSQPLAHEFVRAVGVSPGESVLDVGCGPGALTSVLVELVGESRVAAVDPSPSFVVAIRHRFPEVAVQQAPAEHLPFEDESFDGVLAQLVVHFMSDPGAGSPRWDAWPGPEVGWRQTSGTAAVQPDHSSRSGGALGNWVRVSTMSRSDQA